MKDYESDTSQLRDSIYKGRLGTKIIFFISREEALMS